MKWWLVEAGGEVSRQLSATHTVKLTLDPVLIGQDRQPVEFLVADRDDQPATSTTVESGLADPE
ncbi:hypothetical protein GA707_20485 [Nostocoides sp. F2B08]|nr:hypothetical protein GA707_20485 [Tetrasphaera sp. F2B08]